MDVEDEQIASTRIDPRRLVMAAFGLVGVTVAALATNARFAVVDGVGVGPAELSPLVLGALALAGLFLVGFSAGLLARSNER